MSSLASAVAFALYTPDSSGELSTTPNIGSATPTFTRATEASLTDYEGIIRTAPSGEARMEGARRVENLLYPSGTMEGTWAAPGIASLTDIAGKTLLIEDTSTAAHRVLASAAGVLFAAVAGERYCYSCYVQTAGQTHVYIRLNNAGGDIIAGTVRLSDAVVTQNASATGGEVYAEAVGDGVVRVWGIGTSGSTGTTYPELRLANADTYATYTGDGVSGIYVWDSQIENVTGQSDTSTPGPYVPTTTAAASRYYSTTPSQRVAKNLLKYSEDFSNAVWSKSGGAEPTASELPAPDGTMTATRVQSTGAGARVTQAITNAVGDYIFSTAAYPEVNASGSITLLVYDNTAASVLVNENHPVAAGEWTTISTRVSQAQYTAGNTLIFYIYNGLSSNPIGSVNHYAQTQLEEVTGIPSTYPSDYIATTGAAVSELQEIPSYPLRPVSTVLGIRRFATYAPWEAAETVALGQRRYVEVGGLGYYAVCSTAGATHATTEPTWVADGVEITDNTAGWTIDDTNLYRLKGPLIEEARTNICLQSEDFSAWNLSTSPIPVLTPDAAIAPDGTLTAYKLAPTSTVAQQFIVYSTSAALNTDYCVSVYAKAGEFSWLRLAFGDGVNSVYYDLANGVLGATGASSSSGIEDVGNGWYRCWNVAQNTSNTSVYIFCATSNNATSPTGGNSSDGVYIWGAQLEAGAAPSSYIPTTTAPVTRNADLLTYPTSGWYNDAAGTMLCSIHGYQASTSNRNMWSVNDGYSTDSINGMVYYHAGSKFQSFSYAGGSLVGNITLYTSLLSQDPHIVNFAYDASGYSGGYDGKPVVTDATYSLPDATDAVLYVGAGSSTTYFLNNDLLNLVYIPQRISDADLVTLSAREYSGDTGAFLGADDLIIAGGRALRYDGPVRCIAVDSGYAPISGDVYIAGVLHSVDGAMYITYGAPNSNSVSIAGIRHTMYGVRHVTNSVGTLYESGFAITDDGRQSVTINGADFTNAGIGRTNEGAMFITV